MTDFIVIAVILIIVISAALYIRRAKKSGVKCIGCPVEGGCGGNCGSGTACDCGCHSKK